MHTNFLIRPMILWSNRIMKGIFESPENIFNLCLAAKSHDNFGSAPLALIRHEDAATKNVFNSVRLRGLINPVLEMASTLAVRFDGYMDDLRKLFNFEQLINFGLEIFGITWFGLRILQFL